MERLVPPKGYSFKTKEDVERILAIEADVLRSEGIDPTWPGFPDDEQDDEQPAANGGLAPAAGDALDLGPPLPPVAGALLPSEALDEIRADER